MKEISIKQFRDSGYKLFEDLGVDKLRIVGTKGRYINMFLHNKRDEQFTKEGDVLIDKQGKKHHTCRMCNSIHNIRYIVPYDGAAPAGTYCYYCRRKHSLMDVKDAKRYGKLL